MFSVEAGPSSAKQVLGKQTGSRNSNDAGFGNYALKRPNMRTNLWSVLLEMTESQNGRD